MDLIGLIMGQSAVFISLVGFFFCSWAGLLQPVLFALWIQYSILLFFFFALRDGLLLAAEINSPAAAFIQIDTMWFIHVTYVLTHMSADRTIYVTS